MDKAEATLTTCAVFAPSGTATVLAASADPIFRSTQDGATQLSKRNTRSSFLAPSMSRLSSNGQSLSRVASEASSVSSLGMSDDPAYNAIIACADDHSGVIRIYRELVS